MEKISVLLTGREYNGATLVSICQGHPTNVIMEVYGTVQMSQEIASRATASDLKEVVYVEMTKVLDSESHYVCNIYSQGQDGELGPIIASRSLPNIIFARVSQAPGGGAYFWVSRKGSQLTFLSETQGFPEEREFSNGVLEGNLTESEVVWFRQVVQDLTLLQSKCLESRLDIPIRVLETLGDVISNSRVCLEANNRISNQEEIF